MDYRQTKVPIYSEEETERSELQKKRYADPDVKRKFRNAYCFKVAYDYSTLKPYCENLIMATDGYGDHLDLVRARLETNLVDYDSDKDLIVPAGRTIDHLLVGQIITPKILEKPKIRQSYSIAVYLNYSYKFYMIYLDPTIDTHEVV
jgi:hypothetical protein